MKPYTILNAAMTLDGKIATKTGSSEISNQKDLIRVHRLRKELDAIMVGIGTVLADDPRLTAHKISDNKEDNPLRIVIDSKAQTPLNYRILNKDAKTLIAVNKNADKEKINTLKKHAEILETESKDNRVNMKEVFQHLGNIGIKTLMVEGGSTLNFTLLEEGLIDEIRICIAPMIAGGSEAKTLVVSKGIPYMKDAIQLDFKDSYFIEEDSIPEYLVKK